MVNPYTEMSEHELAKQIEGLKALRSREGRGRRPEAAHVRSHVKAELARIRAEIRKRGYAPLEESVKNLGWNRTEGEQR